MPIMLPDLVEYINGYKVVYKWVDDPNSGSDWESRVQLTINDLEVSNKLYHNEFEAREAAEFFINDHPGHSERRI